jgi:hypothetical protein
MRQRSRSRLKTEVKQTANKYYKRIFGNANPAKVMRLAPFGDQQDSFLLVKLFTISVR